MFFCKLGIISPRKKLKPALVLKRPLPQGTTHYLKTEKMISAKQSNSSWQILPRVSRAELRWGKRDVNLPSGCPREVFSPWAVPRAGSLCLPTSGLWASLKPPGCEYALFLVILIEKKCKHHLLQLPKLFCSCVKGKDPLSLSVLSAGVSFLWQGWWKPKLNLGPNFKQNLNLLSKQ